MYEVLRLGKCISFEAARGGEGEGNRELLLYGCCVSVWCDEKDVELAVMAVQCCEHSNATEKCLNDKF